VRVICGELSGESRVKHEEDSVMRIGHYNIFYYSRNLMDALAKGLPDYFGPQPRWKFEYKQPSMPWKDSVDSDEEGDLVVEKINDGYARVKVSAKDKNGQPTSTILGTLSK
jgi:hypothetical protein